MPINHDGAIRLVHLEDGGKDESMIQLTLAEIWALHPARLTGVHVILKLCSGRQALFLFLVFRGGH